MTLLEQILIKLAEPTEAQKKAGNYKKKHIRYNGMEISIENPAGSMRRGKSPDGKEWSSHMYHHYGYIKGTLGKDKDQIDVFIKPGTKETEKVFVVNQTNKNKGFDEHKCMLGFTTEIAAKRAYLMNYEKGWDGCGSIVEMPIDKFKEWVYSGRKMGPAKQITEKNMNKQAYLEECYLSSFSDELEKNAFVGRAARFLWSPGGKVGQAAKELGKRTLAKRRAVRESLNIGGLESKANQAKQAYRNLKSTQAKQTSRIGQLGEAGRIEQLLGGRLGTRRRRIVKLRNTRGQRFETQRALPGALSKQRSAVAKYTAGKRQLKPELDKVKQEFAGEARKIRLRQGLNIAARTGIVGGGAAIGYKGYKRMSEPAPYYS